MGIKGLSKNVIKQVCRDGRLQDLHNTRLAVDAAGWVVKAVRSNAQDICLEKTGSTAHHADLTRRVQNVLHMLPDSSSLVLVLDGDRWPLKKATHTRRLNARASALEKACAATAANDLITAEKYYKQAVGVPPEFIAWIIHQCKGMARVTVVVAPFEADAQCAQLQKSGQVDIVVSAAEDSDFLVYGMRRVIYNLKQDGTFHEVAVFDDVLGQAIGRFNFTDWSFAQFRMWSCACGCDYVDNIPYIGAAKVYELVKSNLSLTERELCSAIASIAPDPQAYFDLLWAANLSFQHHIVFDFHEVNEADTMLNESVVSLCYLSPLHPDQQFTPLPTLSAGECAGVYFGRLDPKTRQPRMVIVDQDDANAPALEADFSNGQSPTQYSIQRLKAFLVNRGIPVPANLSKRSAIVELVEKVLQYPTGTWPVLSPWVPELAGWTRADPVSLSARKSVEGEACYDLVRSSRFPRIDDTFLCQLLPSVFENTKARAHQLYANHHCHTRKLSVQFGEYWPREGKLGPPIQVFQVRMPVQASMRGIAYKPYVSVSRHRVFLQPSTGCECENRELPCSHTCSVLLVIAVAQSSSSYTDFCSTVKSFSADVLASGSVRWWHTLFPSPGKRERTLPTDLVGTLRRANATRHPFLDRLPAGDPDDVGAPSSRCSSPLYPPHSPGHVQFIRRLLSSPHHPNGTLLAHVVTYDGQWRQVFPTMLPTQRSAATQTEDSEPLVRSDWDGTQHVEMLIDLPCLYSPDATSPTTPSAGSARRFSLRPLSNLMSRLLVTPRSHDRVQDLRSRSPRPPEPCFLTESTSSDEPSPRCRLTYD